MGAHLQRFAVLRLLVGVALALSLFVARAADAKTYELKIGGLEKVVLAGTPPACHAYGILRFPAIKGVDSYTLVFNDARFGGAERSVTVSAPFPEDNFETPYGTIRAPGGTHQDVYTAYHSGGGDCSIDYASRLSNTRMIYTRDGSHIAGYVTKACEDGRCGVKGIKVVARPRGSGGGGNSATTSTLGYYTMKARPGRYNVAPRDGKLTFSPAHRSVTVKKEDTAKADFKVREKGKGAALSVAVKPDHPELNVEEEPGGELEPASTAVRVTVTNTGRDTAENVTLGKLRIAWDDEKVKPPKKLPLVQTLGPVPGTLGDLDPGESATAVYAVEARGDGKYELTARATGTDPSGPVSGTGSARLKASSPVLFMYARVDRRVESEDAPGLFTAGTAFTVRLRLQNRSYTKFVAVEPIAPGLAGNAHDGSVQEAGRPIQVGPAIETLKAVQQAKYEVLKPREERLLDVVVRTHANDPATGQTDGTRAIVTFAKPGALLWDPRAGKVEPLDPAKVALAPDAPLHIVGLDQSVPMQSPFSALEATSNFSTGALVGIAQSLVGVVRGIFYDLPLLAWHGSSAAAQAMIERTAELWRAAKAEKGARAKFDAVMAEGKRQLLEDFRKAGEVPEKLRKAANEAYDGVGKRMTAVANEWYAGDWQGAALDMGLASGRTAGDLVLADLALARGIAVIGRIPKVEKAAQALKLKAQRVGSRATEAFTRRTQTAQRALRFLATKLKPGYIFKLDELIPLYGLTRSQSRFLAKLAKQRQVLITVRSRGAGALKWLRKRAAYVKPEWIKIKNVNRIDTEYLGFHPSHLDSVVVNKNLPSEAEVIAKLDANGVTDPVERAAVLQRRNDRQFELDTDEPGYVKQIEGYANSNAKVESRFNWTDNQLDPKGRGSKTSTAQFRLTEEGNPGNVVVRVKVGKGGGYKRVTGDNDIVSITKADGTPLSNDELVEVLDELRGPPMCIQHPATDTWVLNGVADHAAKRKQLGQERPVQFGADGKARLVEFNNEDKVSWFKSALEYNIAWKGGYRHIGNYPAPSYTKPQKPFRSPAPCFVSR